MKAIDCGDRERILREQDPEMLEALDRHAATCAECGEELRLLREIFVAAREMHKEWETPHLWPRIEEALTAPSPWRALFSPWIAWPAFATLAVLVGVLFLYRAPVTVPTDARRLLTEQALREVESSEAAYTASIDKLAALASPKIDRKTPLMASYREKLLLLDAAIADCRAQIAQNRGNPQVRQELLAMYQDKQRTLEAVIREE